MVWNPLRAFQCSKPLRTNWAELWAHPEQVLLVTYSAVQYAFTDMREILLRWRLRIVWLTVNALHFMRVSTSCSESSPTQSDIIHHRDATHPSNPPPPPCCGLSSSCWFYFSSSPSSVSCGCRIRTERLSSGTNGQSGGSRSIHSGKECWCRSLLTLIVFTSADVCVHESAAPLELLSPLL